MNKERYLIRLSCKPVGMTGYVCLYFRGFCYGELYFNEDPKLAHSYTWEMANKIVESENFQRTIKSHNDKARQNGGAILYPVVTKAEWCKMSNHE